MAETQAGGKSMRACRDKHNILYNQSPYADRCSNEYQITYHNHYERIKADEYSESLSKIFFEILRNTQKSGRTSHHAWSLFTALLPPIASRAKRTARSPVYSPSSPTLSFLLLYGPPSLHILSPLSTTPPLSPADYLFPVGPPSCPHLPPFTHESRAPLSWFTIVMLAAYLLQEMPLQAFSWCLARDGTVAQGLESWETIIIWTTSKMLYLTWNIVPSAFHFAKLAQEDPRYIQWLCARALHPAYDFNGRLYLHLV